MTARSRQLWLRICLGLAALILLFLLVQLIFRFRVLSHSLASREYLRRDYRSAEKTWAKALDPRDGDPIPEASLGKLFYRRGDYERAANSLSQAAREKEGSSAIHYDLGNTLFRSDQLDEALQQYKAAMLLSATDKDAKMNYELVLRKKGYNPPPPENDGNNQQNQESQAKKDQYSNSLEALDQKESSDRKADRQSKGTEDSSKWW